MPDPAPIRSPRLVLPFLSVPEMERLIERDVAAVATPLAADLSERWLAEAEPLLRIRVAQLRDEPEQAPWILRAILLDGDPPHPAIGFINFHDGPRDRGWVEVGYTILPEWRRRGYAAEAVAALCGWAHRNGADRFRASVSPANGPSLGLVAKLGFGWIGEQWDPDDGLELVFERTGAP